MSYESLRELADLLKTTTGWARTLATIEAVASDGTVTLSFGGTDTVSGIPCAAHVTPVTGQAVWAATKDGRVLYVESIMTSTDSGWLTNGVVYPTSGVTWAKVSERYRRMGNIVYFNVTVYNSSGSSIAVTANTGKVGTGPVALFTLPVGFRPTTTVGVTGGNNTRVCGGYISSNGVAALTYVAGTSAIGTTEYVNLCGSFPV